LTPKAALKPRITLVSSSSEIFLGSTLRFLGLFSCCAGCSVKALIVTTKLIMPAKKVSFLKFFIIHVYGNSILHKKLKPSYKSQQKFFLTIIFVVLRLNYL